MTATSKLTTFWQEAAGTTLTAAVFGLIFYWLLGSDSSIGHGFTLSVLLLGSLTILALVTDGIRRLLRKLIGYRVRVVFERVR